jgi:hypothetical protein
MPAEFGAEDYGEDVFGGILERNIDTTVDGYLPEVFPLDDDGRIITRYIDAHEEEFGGIDGAQSYVRLSHYVDEAEGRDLDRVGRLFGQLGNRGARDTEEYRTFLSNLINSFNARGTLSGLRFAVAAAASTEPENVVIDEDFVNNEYEISIVDTDSEFLSSAVNDLAELADPSAVRISAPPIIITTGDEVLLDATESAVIDSTTGLGANTLTLDGNSQLTGTL